jgi:hypothetical protein
MSMKLVRCECGHEHNCPARLSNKERAVKAANARLKRTPAMELIAAIGKTLPNPERHASGAKCLKHNQPKCDKSEICKIQSGVTHA